MFQQTKGGPGAGKSGSKTIALANLNTNYHEYLKRVAHVEAEKIHQPFFTAGLFVDREGKALLVKDRQDNNPDKVWFKLPGGVAEGCFSHHIFCSNLHEYLIKTKYNERIMSVILKKEEANPRPVTERGLILEFVEETGFYPTSFGYGCDGYRYNTKTWQHDLWQVYFTIHSVISPYSRDLNEGIKIIRKVVKAIAIDKDIEDMRATVRFEGLIEKLGSYPQKKGAQALLKKQASHFMSSNADLSRRYGLAAMAKVD